ncbi:MAG: TonB-dependent receptor plug domain-containing protein [Candidatus Marinimicrobia bacterium]|jgi:outer membrane receptor for ferrienterochelin and colicin|nr:TonB-dependent receptor plug domain-containing protein [Candidatus Neomarinimicrobiota bacterium]
MLRSYQPLLTVTFFLTAFSHALAGTIEENSTNVQQLPVAATSAIDNLFSAFDDVTAIATDTKQNVDYVPGILSVLYGDELKLLGVKNIHQALEHVPGIYTMIDSTGNSRIVIRGLGGEGNMVGHVRLMIDESPFNYGFFGESHGTFDLPISLIERIEVIRGPAASLYGQYAHAGVIRVVTKKRTPQLFSSWDAEKGNRLNVGGQINVDLANVEGTVTFNHSSNQDR